MTMQFSAPVRSSRLDAIEIQIGPSPKLRIYSGAKPTNITDAAAGVLLVEMALPSNWMADAVAGVKALTGGWNGTGIVGGNAGWFGILDNAGTTRHIQGSVTSVATGTGDMLIDNVNVAASQAVVVSTFQLTDNNAG